MEHMSVRAATIRPACVQPNNGVSIMAKTNTIEIQKIVSPGSTQRVDATKYEDMKI
jgi:hypothetical protein